MEDEAINANSVLGTSEEEMKAEYDKFDALYREAKNSLVKMQELSDAVTALVELLETTEYPGAAAAEKACEDALALIDHQDENATYQDILNMIDAIAKAERDYMLSQEATHETPADYTFLITNPQVYTNNAGWEGSTPAMNTTWLNSTTWIGICTRRSPTCLTVSTKSACTASSVRAPTTVARLTATVVRTSSPSCMPTRA